MLLALTKIRRLAYPRLLANCGRRPLLSQQKLSWKTPVMHEQVLRDRAEARSIAGEVNLCLLAFSRCFAIEAFICIYARIHRKMGAYSIFSS